MTPIFSDKDDAFLLTNYSKYGALYCADQLNKKSKQITSRMSYLRKRDRCQSYVDSSVLSTTLSLALTKDRKPHEYKVNPTQFSDITTPQVAYLLGLLWADGCVYINSSLNAYQIIINNLVDDMRDVESIFFTTGAWAKCHVDKKEGQPQTRFSTNGRMLALHLESQGYRSKNGFPHILKIIPRHLLHYWFRGLMDGDGCFYISPKHNCANICGPKDQDWSYITPIMDELGVIYKIKITQDFKRGGSRSTIIIRDLRSINKWGHFIYMGYEEDRIGFTRKWEKFKQLKDRYEKSYWWKSVGLIKFGIDQTAEPLE